MKNYLLILASLMSLSHLPLQSGEPSQRRNGQTRGNGQTFSALAVGTILIGGTLCYYYRDKIKSYWNGSPVANTEKPTMNSSLTYKPELKEELLLSNDSAREESAPIIITEHKAQEELKDILHTPKDTPTQQAYSALVTATAKLKETLETTKEIFKNKTASEVFERFPLD